MLKFSNWSPRARAAIVAAICLGLAAPALAGTFYSWQTEDGVYSYTDDAKRIPALYKAAAKKQTLGSLAGYRRYTPSTAVKGDPHERMAARLEKLREAGEEVVMVKPRAAAPGLPAAPVHIELDDLEIDVSEVEGDEPIVVEQVRTQEPGAMATRTVKVVRQGDRVIAVIKPVRNQENLSSLPTEDDIERSE
jgi:hypothetical protein